MGKVKQVRGDKLRDKIVEGIKTLAASAKEAGRSYIYNATHLAAEVGTSRPSLAKHYDLIEKTLKDLEARKRMENGEGVIQLFRERVQRLESDKEVLVQELEALRRHHADLYRRIYYNATDLEPLIRPIVEEETVAAERCILCNHQIEEIENQILAPQKEGKVIKLRPHESPQARPSKK